MAKLVGVTDAKAKEILCPVCKKILLFYNADAKGTIYPYCKLCKKNIAISLPVK